MADPIAIPAAPDFNALAQQQGNINQQAAWNATSANRPDQYNQNGSLTWNYDPTGNRWTQNVALNGANQDLWNTYTAGMQQLGSQVGTPGLWQSQDVTAGVPGMPDSGFGATQSVIDAMRGLQQPLLDKSRDAERARMAAMGLTLGSAASDASEDTLGRTANDADLKAILAGTTEYGNVFNRGLQARQQGVSENVQRQNLLTALRSAQTGAIGQLGNARTGLNPTFQNFSAATAPTPTNVYQAGQDQFSAGLKQFDAARANYNAALQAQANNRQGNLSAAGLGLSSLGGLSGLGGLFNGARSVYDWMRGDVGVGDQSSVGTWDYSGTGAGAGVTEGWDNGVYPTEW